MAVIVDAVDELYSTVPVCGLNVPPFVNVYRKPSVPDPAFSVPLFVSAPVEVTVPLTEVRVVSEPIVRAPITFMCVAPTFSVPPVVMFSAPITVELEVNVAVPPDLVEARS